MWILCGFYVLWQKQFFLSHGHKTHISFPPCNIISLYMCIGKVKECGFAYNGYACCCNKTCVSTK